MNISLFIIDSDGVCALARASTRACVCVRVYVYIYIYIYMCVCVCACVGCGCLGVCLCLCLEGEGILAKRNLQKEDNKVYEHRIVGKLSARIGLSLQGLASYHQQVVFSL